MHRLKVLVTGANGQVGRELQAVSYLYPEFEFIFLSKEALPINDKEKVVDAFAAISPHYCINCAAYTAVDRAEIEKDLAFLINGESSGILAGACNSFNAKFIHISTDYVFNGNATLPYNEDDLVDPVNAYGASKLSGELLALNENAQSIIIRTSWVYSEFGNNFVKTMIRLMKQKPLLGVVNDQRGSPTYAADLAALILNIIKSGDWTPGIYNYSNEGIITWYEFAKAIKGYIGSECDIRPITTDDFPTAARRPAYSGLDKTKIISTFNAIVPKWEDSLKICIQKLTV